MRSSIGPGEAPMSAFSVQWRFISPAQLTAALAAGVFALVIPFVPWESFGVFPYADFMVYLEIFALGSQSIQEMYHPGTIIEFYSHEVVWDEFVRFIVRIVDDPFIALKLVSIFVLWVNAYILYRRYGYLLPTLLLVNPLFLGFALSQLRLAFAITLLVLALNARRRAVQGAFVLASFFIHSSVPIFIGLFVVVKCVERFGQDWSLHRLLALVGVVCGGLIFVLVFGRDALLMAMDDRRAFLYADAYGSTSFLYASFWVGMIAMQVAAGREYLRRPDNLYSIMILALFVGMTLLQTYGTRFVAAAFPVVVASALNLPPENRIVVLPAFLLFQIVQFLYWFGINVI